MAYHPHSLAHGREAASAGSGMPDASNMPGRSSIAGTSGPPMHADAERCEAVNPEVAEAMAAGALEKSPADFAIAITGFCGPREKDEEVGLVHLACATRKGRRFAQEYHFGDIGRAAVLDHAVAAALAMMTEALASHSAPVLHSA